MPQRYVSAYFQEVTQATLVGRVVYFDSDRVRMLALWAVSNHTRSPPPRSPGSNTSSNAGPPIIKKRTFAQ